MMLVPPLSGADRAVFVRMSVGRPMRGLGVNEKQRNAAGGRWGDPAKREQKSAETKARWADPEGRSKLMAGIRDTERRTRIATAMRARWADPLKREKTIAAMKAAWLRRRQKRRSTRLASAK